MSKVKTLLLDRSRPFATVHGERSPEDPHYKAHFQQDGLMFDGKGLLVEELVPDHLKEKVNKKLAKLRSSDKQQVPSAPPPADGATDGDNPPEEEDDDDGDQGDPNDINIEAWLRGLANYQWFALAKAIRTRYNKNVSKQEDAVEFLVHDQKIISPSEVAEKFKGYL